MGRERGSHAVLRGTVRELLYASRALRASRLSVVRGLSEGEHRSENGGKVMTGKLYRGHKIVYDPTAVPLKRGDGGRDAIERGECSLTEWLAWDWSRQADERLDAIALDVSDLADRVHVLNAIVLLAFLVMTSALAIMLGLILL